MPTIATVEADLVEYADFEEVASVSRAKLFVTAAKRWLILRPESASNQSSSLSMGEIRSFGDVGPCSTVRSGQ
jgi:hypothetical protein